MGATRPEVAAMSPLLAKVKMGEFAIPLRYRATRLATLAARGPGQREALAACRGFVETLHERYVTPSRPAERYPEDADTIGRGITLVGPPGCGKTTLAVATLMEVYSRYPLGVFFAHWPTYVGWAMDANFSRSPADGVDPAARVAAAERAPVVVLDDVGAEYRSQAGWALSEFSRVLRVRHNAARPTLVTTNIPGPKWAASWGEATQSFLAGANDVVVIADADQRRAR